MLRCDDQACIEAEAGVSAAESAAAMADWGHLRSSMISGLSRGEGSLRLLERLGSGGARQSSISASCGGGSDGRCCARPHRSGCCHAHCCCCCCHTGQGLYVFEPILMCWNAVGILIIARAYCSFDCRDSLFLYQTSKIVAGFHAFFAAYHLSLFLAWLVVLYTHPSH